MERPVVRELRVVRASEDRPYLGIEGSVLATGAKAQLGAPFCSARQRGWAFPGGGFLGERAF